MSLRPLPTVVGLAVMAALGWAGPVPAQTIGCEWTNDGECDEPGIGTGICSAASDAADCAGDKGHFKVLAVSDSTCAWSYVDEQGSRLQLHQRALSQCGVNDCRVVATVETSCIAFARGADGCGWGIAGDAAQAESNAQEACVGACPLAQSSCR